MSRALFIRKLNPFNFPLALVASFFLQVVCWRTERMSHRWLRRFAIMDPAKLFTTDEWLAIAAEAQKSGKKFMRRRYAHHTFTWSLLGLRIDLTHHWLQFYANSLEEYYFFSHMVSRWSKRFMPTGIRYVANSSLDRQFPIEQISDKMDHAHFLHIFSWIDRCWHWIMAAVYFIHSLLLLLNVKKDPVTAEKRHYPYLWSGISSTEVAKSSGRLDITFLAERRLIKTGECLYILPSNPTPEARKYLAKKEVHWSTKRACISWLTLSERFYTACSLFWTAFQGIIHLRNRYALPVLMQYCFRMLAWIPVAKTLKPDVYLTSVSCCWPEDPEISVMNALGIRTVNWSYGANTFGFAHNNPHFEDLGVMRSISVAQEIWIWNASVAEWLGARKIFSNGATGAVRMTGPVMCGDASWLDKAPDEVRRLHHIDSEEDVLYISVFDVPPVNEEQRLQLGHGPTPYPLEMLEQFFMDITEILRQFPSVRIIVKPKRALDDPKGGRDFASNMLRLIEPNGIYRRDGRVLLLEPDIDPYVPIAMADICIGVPFTSPVLVGIKSGRQGVFHDPLSSILYFAPKAMQSLVTHGRQELMQRLDIFLRELKNSRSNLAPSAEAEIYLGPAGDPAVRFANMLRDATYA